MNQNVTSDSLHTTHSFANVLTTLSASFYDRSGASPRSTVQVLPYLISVPMINSNHHKITSKNHLGVYMFIGVHFFHFTPLYPMPDSKQLMYPGPIETAETTWSKKLENTNILLERALRRKNTCKRYYERYARFRL